VTFTGIAANVRSGTVNFAPAIAATGGTAWFSLEEPPSLTFTVTPVIGGGGAVPEPTSMLLLGTGLLTGARRWRRRNRNTK